MALRKLVRRTVRSAFQNLWVELFAVVTRPKRQLPVSTISDLVNKRYFALNEYTARRCFLAWVQTVTMKKRLYKQLTHFNKLREKSWIRMVWKAWRTVCQSCVLGHLYLLQNVPANAHRQLQRSVIRKWFNNWRKSSDVTHAFGSYCTRTDTNVKRELFVQWRDHQRRSQHFKKGLKKLFKVLLLPGPRKVFGALALLASVHFYIQF